MFTHQLFKDDKYLHVSFNDYAKRHYLKRFEKDYKGEQWKHTKDSIFRDLERIKTVNSDLQLSQKVDELWYKDNCWIFKYDFRVALTKESTKSSGNRCVVFLDNGNHTAQILIIFGKNDLPKNSGEQAYIEQTLTSEFSEIMTTIR